MSMPRATEPADTVVIAGVLSYSTRWHRRHRDPRTSEVLQHRLREVGVGDHPGHRRDRQQRYSPEAWKLQRLCEYDDVVGACRHLLDHRRAQVVPAREAGLGRKTVDAYEQLLDVEPGEALLDQRPDSDLRLGLVVAAQEDDGRLSIPYIVRDERRVRDDRDATLGLRELVGEQRAARAGLDHDGGAVRYEVGGGRGDPALDVVVKCEPTTEVVRCDRHRVPMLPRDQPVPLEVIEVLADGHLRHAEPLGQLVDVDALGVDDVLEDPRPPFSDHGCPPSAWVVMLRTKAREHHIERSMRGGGCRADLRHPEVLAP